jgi:hypothetical protein
MTIGQIGYTGSVTLTCTGLPAGVSCTFNPGTLTLAGGTAQSSMLTVSTAAGNMACIPKTLQGPGMTMLSCGIFAGSLLLLWPKRRRAYWMMLALAGSVCCPWVVAAILHHRLRIRITPAGTYSFQVAATAGTTQAATSFTLVVQ